MFMIPSQVILTNLFLAALEDEEGKFFNFYQISYCTDLDIITQAIKTLRFTELQPF